MQCSDARKLERLREGWNDGHYSTVPAFEPNQLEFDAFRVASLGLVAAYPIDPGLPWPQQIEVSITHVSKRREAAE